MTPPSYRLIDHTADFGIEVFGTDLADLFVQAGLALFDLITNLKDVQAQETVQLAVQGEDLADLMVNWLRELLYLWNGNERLVKTIRIRSVDETAVSADIGLETYQPGRHQIQHEIKAVTYHQIRVEPIPSGYAAAVIFDV
jgi:SHS2 domain-containing protein